MRTATELPYNYTGVTKYNISLTRYPHFVKQAFPNNSDQYADHVH